MRKTLRATIEVDAEWLRWTNRDEAQRVILREINRLTDPWFRAIAFEDATSVKVRRTEPIPPGLTISDQRSGKGDPNAPV